MGEQIFESAMSAINMPYRIPNVRVETAEVPAHARIGWFRSVANIPHAFAAQLGDGDFHAASVGRARKSPARWPG